MLRHLLVSLSFVSVPLALLVLVTPAGAQQAGRDVGCADWRECRQMAQAAAERGNYERFHDLAWRAVQLGPARDTSLMSLLAHAQALSGRPHDALVMIERLAEVGVVVDADTSDDFARTRQLPEWPAVRARLEAVRQASSVTPPAATPPPAPGAPTTTNAAAASPTAPSPAAAWASSTEAVTFSTRPFTPAGIAYDAVSARFLFADRSARKLFVVSERSNRAIDFVRADSAGFQDIAGIEIDAGRGDLWVASTAPAAGTGTLHRLQLVSGRPLRSFPMSADVGPVSLVDLAVTASGAVVVLDSSSPQLLMLRPGATTVTRLLRLDVREPESLAVSGDGSVAYVAHRDGVLRVDLRRHTANPLTSAASILLDRVERIHWHDRALIAVRADEDGTRSIVRLDMNASGRAVTRATTLEHATLNRGPVFLTWRGDELVYIVDGSGRPGGGAAADPSSPAKFTVYRVGLR